MCLLLWPAADRLSGHTIKGTTLLSWSWEVYSLTQSLWILRSAEQYSGLSHGIMPWYLSCFTAWVTRWDHSGNLCVMKYRPSGGEVETQVHCRSWVQSMRYSETGTGILPGQGQSLQYFTLYMFMAPTCKCGVMTKHFSKKWEKLSRSLLVSLLTP